MQAILINKLLEYIKKNNPDVLFQLEAEGKLRGYLYNKLASVSSMLIQMEEEQPQYIIEEACLNAMITDLLPSKYNYICNILGEEFPEIYQQLVDNGLLQFEIINIIGHCQPVFEELAFNQANEDNQFIKYAIIGSLSEYLQRNSEKENVSDELQQSTETER